MKRILALATIVLVALAGCTSTPEASSPSASPVASESATPSATPSETPSPTPSETAAAAECPTWSDDPDAAAAAIGPISFAGACIGHSFDDAIAAGAALTAPEACPWVGELVAIDDPGLYVSAYSDPEDPGAYIGFFVLRWFADPADAASFEMPRTAEGITIGSSAAEVLDAYPDATEVEFDDIARGPRLQMVVPTTDTTTYNFDITDGVVTEISWGENLDQGGPNGDLCAL